MAWSSIQSHLQTCFYPRQLFSLIFVGLQHGVLSESHRRSLLCSKLCIDHSMCKSQDWLRIGSVFGSNLTCIVILFQHCSQERCLQSRDCRRLVSRNHDVLVLCCSSRNLLIGRRPFYLYTFSYVAVCGLPGKSFARLLTSMFFWLTDC